MKNILKCFVCVHLIHMILNTHKDRYHMP